MSSHPDPETLTRFVRGTLGREQRREVEQHLATCPLCSATLDSIPPAPGPETVVRWRAHLFAERRRRSEQEEEQRRSRDETARALGGVIGGLAERQVRELLAGSEHERRRRLREEEGLPTLPLCELLLARCRAAWRVDPDEAVELARLAAQVAERLDPGVYGGRVEGARSLAWMHQGIAYRIAAEWRELQENASAVAEAGPEGEEADEPPLFLTDPQLPRYEIENALWELRDAYLDRGMGFDAVLVTLDLLEEPVREKRRGEVRRLLEESLALGETQGVPAAALDALRALREVEDRGEPPFTPELLGRTAALLLRVRNDPQHRWS